MKMDDNHDFDMISDGIKEARTQELVGEGISNDAPPTIS